MEVIGTWREKNVSTQMPGDVLSKNIKITTEM